MRNVLKTKQKLDLNKLLCLLNSPVEFAVSTISGDKITVFYFRDKHSAERDEVTYVSSGKILKWYK